MKTIHAQRSHLHLCLGRLLSHTQLHPHHFHHGGILMHLAATATVSTINQCIGICAAAAVHTYLVSLGTIINTAALSRVS